MQKVYDCQGIMHLDRFQSLKNEAFFNTVTVDPGGYGVSWNDETDLSEYELWNNGIGVDAVSEKMRGFLKGIDTTMEREPDRV
jgi:hypothetical protein